MNSNGSGPYSPFAHQQGLGHQGINPAMLASYNQQQQQPQQPGQYAGVTPAQLMNGMGTQQQQHQQQQMVMNGAGLNPSALSAAANSGGGMPSFMNGGAGMINPQMQPPQTQITPQALQLLASVGVTREQLIAMTPAERQTTLRNAVAMRQQQQMQMQNQQAQQQQFPLDYGGSYERPGSAMGMGMGTGSPVGMGGGEYQQNALQQQNGFQHGKPLAPPQFGPGFAAPTQGMPPLQHQPQQNPGQGSFPPGSPYNRPAQRLPPSDPQPPPQVLRSNSMGPPPPVLRSSSASGSEVNGYSRPLSSNSGGTPQPQRQPSFGPQAQRPQRHPSVSRSSSPMKPAPSTPLRTEPVPSATPSAVPPPTALPAASAAAPAPSLAASLAPLPSSVNLNPAVTRVTVVPLASSLTTIPPVAPDEVASVKDWLEADRLYEGVFREMKMRMGAEYRELMGPGSIPWWEKGTLDHNASRFSYGREKFEVRYPYRRKERDSSTRKKGARREGLKLPRKLDPEDANRPEELVPIRLEFDVEHHKIRDTFVWNMNACVVSPEHFAQTVVEDYNLAPSYHGVITKAIQDQLSDYRAHSAKYDGDSWDALVNDETLLAGTLEGESAAWWCKWRKRLRTEYVRAERGKGGKRRKVVKDEPENEGPMSVEEFTVDAKTLHEDMRILIRLDIIVGSMKLDDQFEWDLDNVEASPEDFAQIYTQELGLGGEFRTAIAHSIREQVHAYQKSLFLVGHPMDGGQVQDEDLRNSFLPSLSTGARAMDQVQAFTPLLNYLSDGELERHEKERDKDYNKRRKRNRGGRRGVALPDRDPIRTYRTPAIGFPEPDPATLAAAAAAAAPMSRRAAAAAASLTIANLVASENGGPTYTPSSLPAVPAPPPLIIKEKTTKGFFKPPPYDTAVLRPRARIPAPIPSTAADISKLPAPLENDPPPPPSRRAAAPVIPDRAPRAVTAKRAKELEREAKEKEFAEGQQQNMINGVWHCSNCGCPDSIAVGRRKGPLGDKSQCGTCGKYWHRYRKPRPVEYNSDYEFHATGHRKEADHARRPRGRPQSGTVPLTPADTSEPQTPRDSAEGPSRQSPVRDSSPVSTASSTSERPLAQVIKKTSHMPSTPPPPPPPHAAPASVWTPKLSPIVVPASIAPPDSSAPAPPSVEAAAPPVVSPPTNSSAAPVSAPRPVPSSPAKLVERPQWLLVAMQAMQAEWKNDRFDVIPKHTAANSPEWRIKCLDCPGKVYITGPGETLDNYELHLKNRLHRQRVNDRMGNSRIS